MDNSETQITGKTLEFACDVNKKSLREYFNDRFPDLATDPIDIFANSEQGTLQDLKSLLGDAGMSEQTLRHLEDRKKDEFQSFLTLAPNVSGARFLIEHGTGHKMAVVPAGFLANVIEQLQKTPVEMETPELFHYGARMCLMYSYGLLVYDEINPLITLESETADRLNKSMALSILQTGIGDLADNESSVHDLPSSLITDYMTTVQPQRFASAMMYADLERTLGDSLDKVTAASVLDRFMEGRVAAVAQKVQHDSRLAVSGIDWAFAYPLSSEDLQSIIQFGSVIRENTRRPLKLVR